MDETVEESSYYRSMEESQESAMKRFLSACSSFLVRAIGGDSQPAFGRCNKNKTSISLYKDNLDCYIEIKIH